MRSALARRILAVGVLFTLVVVAPAVVLAQTRPVPRIDRVFEDPAGLTLNIYGAHFGEAPTVWIEGQAVPVRDGATDSQLVIDLPAEWAAQPGTYRLEVRSARGPSDTFEVMVGHAAPLTGAAPRHEWSAGLGARMTPPAGAGSGGGEGHRAPVVAGPVLGPLLVEQTGYPYATAVGHQALASNTGAYNTAAGFQALYANTTGGGNTAAGAWALAVNTTGANNTAAGFGALGSHATGNNNTAAGYNALAANTTGAFNTAAGATALAANISGQYNTATGYQALASNSTAFSNTATGYLALGSHTAGDFNTATGVEALLMNSVGTRNLALGYRAGYNATGSHNVYLAHDGVAAENGTIRIGTPGVQTRFFAAGIRGVKVTKVQAVKVDQNGQLGYALSSRRYKTDIRDIDHASAGLFRLRPVSYRYKDSEDPSPQFGLIAEEVADVYPDLVTRDAEGRIETVLYDQLVPLLLNETQRQEKTINAQGAEIAALKAALAQLEARVAAMSGGNR